MFTRTARPRERDNFIFNHWVIAVSCRGRIVRDQLNANL